LNEPSLKPIQLADAPSVANRDGHDQQATATLELSDPALFTNRELSWLDFNDRVLQLAEDESIPLIERLKFLAIFVTNLDEFFMIRVAGVHDQVDARIDARGPDDLAPTEVLERIAGTVRQLDQRHARQFSEVIRPALAEHGIRIVSCANSGAPASEIEHMISAGCSARRSSKPSPARAITPGAKFSTTTSILGTIALIRSRPRACLISTARLFFE